MCLGEPDTGLTRIAWNRVENQRSGLRCRIRHGPADRAHPYNRIHVLGSTIITEIVRAHRQKLGERAPRRCARRLAAAYLLVGDGGPDCSAPHAQAAASHRTQFRFHEPVEQRAPLIIEGCAQDVAEVRIDAIRPREAERSMRTLLDARAGQRQYAAEHLAVVAHLHSAVVLESAHVNAKLLDYLKVRGHVRNPVAGA
jgi:hypothetical protein